MIDIYGDEIEPAGEGNATVQTETSEGLPPSSDSPDVGVVDNKGGKKRKAPKQPKTKSVGAAENDGGGSPVAAGATAEVAADEQAGKSEEGGATSAADYALAAYRNLGAWPESAGPTKRELAVAAYLRDEAGQFTLIQVAEALRAVLGGEFNVQRNVVKGLEADGLVKINKVTIEGVGTSFHLELTAAGEAKVNEWLVEHQGARPDATKPTV
jgi:hypothetical protein